MRASRGVSSVPRCVRYVAKPVHVEGVMKVNGEDGVPSTRSAVIGTAAGHPHSRGVSTARRGCGQSSFGAAVGLRRTEAHL